MGAVLEKGNDVGREVLGEILFGDTGAGQFVKGELGWLVDDSGMTMAVGVLDGDKVGADRHVAGGCVASSQTCLIIHSQTLLTLA